MHDAVPVEELDIGPWLEAGEQPLEQVMQRLNQLDPGETLSVRAPFEPAPLMDMAVKKGFEVVVNHVDPNGVQVLFHRLR